MPKKLQNPKFAPLTLDSTFKKAFANVILPRFNKTESECKTIMDKVLFVLKNGHKLKGVPKSFREKELMQMFKIAEISKSVADIIDITKLPKKQIMALR